MNNSQGVADMAFNCTLMPVKVLDYSGSGSAQSLADGLYWAADHGAQVINTSLGWPPGYNPGSTVSNAITYAYNAGVVLLASSGNSGTGKVSYPAAYSQVIAVGATTYDDRRPSYSQYCSALEICACGGDMCDASGNIDDVYIDEIEFRGMGAGGSAEDQQIFAGKPDGMDTVPGRFAVSHNRPNPFNTMTEFSISLPEPARVTTEVYTMQGQRVASLTDEVMVAGTHVIRWDGTNSAGESVASGICFYRVIADDSMITRKMVLTR
jgi:hypothetical protein